MTRDAMNKEALPPRRVDDLDPMLGNFEFGPATVGKKHRYTRKIQSALMFPDDSDPELYYNSLGRLIVFDVVKTGTYL